MVKKKGKKPTKKVSKKVVKKPAKVTPQKLEIVVRSEANQPTTVVPPEVLLPEKDGKKLVLAKSWVSESQVLKILQQTPPKHILKRKGKGGMMFDYVTGNYMRKVLNYVFAWNWDFEISKQEVFGLELGWGQVITTGKLTVKNDKGQTITKVDNGKADVKYKKDTKIPMDLGNDFKASATDALKRCAAQLGIASDVYGKGELRDEGVRVQDPAPVAPQPANDKHDGVDAPIVDYVCSKCGNDITPSEAEFSKKMFGTMLCREHQKEAAEKRNKKS